MNNVAGIDVSKGKSMVSVLRPFREVEAKPFSVGHTGGELKELSDYLKSLDGEIRVVMEHTGRYYGPVICFLHEKGVFFGKANLKRIKDYGNDSLRKVKTDKADARKAEFGDVTRFTHRGAITAFAGIAPGTDQSSTHEAKSNRTSKSGPLELHKVLFLVMYCLLKTQPELTSSCVFTTAG